jgi:hypothetical protein
MRQPDLDERGATLSVRRRRSEQYEHETGDGKWYETAKEDHRLYIRTTRAERFKKTFDTEARRTGDQS